jgi:CRISPR-associated protein Cas1
VTLTGAAVAGILDAGLDVTLHSSSGRFRGVISSVQAKNVFLLLAQVDAWNRPERRVAFARPVVLGKIAGQRMVLQRQALDRGSARCAAAVERLDALERKVREEDDVDALRGLEGAAAAVYFDAFGEMLGGEWRFPGRFRRPPKDPVNALLSFGYTLACSEVARALILAGFDTRLGLLHGIRYGRESLALDLVEEFRAPMVDRFTLRLLNKRQLAPEDFETREDGAVRLAPDGRRQYLELWEEMLARKAARLRRESGSGDDPREEHAQRLGRGQEGGSTGRSPRARMLPEREASEGEAGVSWRFRIERQVRRLRRFLMEGGGYRPLLGGEPRAGRARRNGGIDSHERDDGEETDGTA